MYVLFMCMVQMHVDKTLQTHARTHKCPNYAHLDAVLCVEMSRLTENVECLSVCLSFTLAFT